MLQLLNISNIALIENLRVEFDTGLNLLTGETGSGKSIIVDALGLLIGGRFTGDLLRTGSQRGFIEGLFSVTLITALEELLQSAGIFPDDGTEHKREKPKEDFELIIRRDVSTTGRNKIFINNQLATQTLLRDLRPFLIDIHGQGDQQTLFNPDTHLDLLDAFAGANAQRDLVKEARQRWSKLKYEYDALKRDEADKLQLVDTLTFQIQEIDRAQLSIGVDDALEDERRRLTNVEKLTALSQASYSRIYEDDDAALARLRQTINEVTELADFEANFREYLDGLESARAVLEDLSYSLRAFADKLEFSPTRLAEIEERLAELSRLKRKYGGSIVTTLEHLARSQDRLRQIEQSDQLTSELTSELKAVRDLYLERAANLHSARVRAAKNFEKTVIRGIAEVAMENSRFEVRINTEIPAAEAIGNESGIDRVEFFFSANAGEDLKPLARVASGGEASRLMLVLKTVANPSEFPRTIVFDEIDTGIGGRVSEAVGAKLKKLSATNQVLCVTHQSQIARFADNHLAVRKEVLKGHTTVHVEKLDRHGRIEELARMLTGAEITDSARRHAKELLKT